jgi:hypothetical protein
MVDGHKVGSAIFTHSYPLGPLKSIAVGTIVGKDNFLLTYSVPAAFFDQNLPTFENIIKSIKFHDVSSGQNDTMQQQQP